ncbi:MAG: DUF4321 domain-containing protein [Candidatus Ratteibacteria bacterium]
MIGIYRFFILLLSFLCGSALGEILQILLPDIARSYPPLAFTASWSFAPIAVNLAVCSFTFGASITVNTLSFLGAGISAIILLFTAKK